MDEILPDLFILKLKSWIGIGNQRMFALSLEILKLKKQNFRQKKFGSGRFSLCWVKKRKNF